MRLEITRRSDLAIRVLLVLSEAPGRRKAAQLAEQVGTSQGFLTQVMTPLVQHGWVRSDPGPTGGYAADFEPETVSLLSIIEAVEGPTDTGRCVLEDRACSKAGLCALHHSWSSARGHLLDELAAQRLSTLLVAGDR